MDEQRLSYDYVIACVYAHSVRFVSPTVVDVATASAVVSVAFINSGKFLCLLIQC